MREFADDSGPCQRCFGYLDIVSASSSTKELVEKWNERTNRFHGENAYALVAKS